MIPAANIIAWRRHSPWPNDTQVEQDLVLSRLIVEIANHELLGEELAFRGGTYLHKLRLPEPARYSEDLDYVRRTETGTGGSIVNAKFECDPTSGAGRIRVKVEVNIAETAPFSERAKVPYEVDSPWWSGSAQVNTFTVEELLGTKLRALYQRSKGRDLFDLWCAMTQLPLDDDRILAAFRHYIGEEEFTFPQLARNLEAKLEDRDFSDDLGQLVQVPPQGYDLNLAADLVMTRLGALLQNAPDPGDIESGGWRLSS